MTDQPKNATNTDPATDEDKEMNGLFGDASLRPQPSAELLARAKAAARPEWEAAVARHKASTRPEKPYRTWAMVAGLALLALVSVNQLVSGPELDVQVVRADRLSQNRVELQGGYMMSVFSSMGDDEKGEEGKCGAGKCGGTDKGGEGKCGEGKCGGDTKSSEGKCGAGKCGSDMNKSHEGKGGAGKCGGTDKHSEGKCGEGKCGSSR